MPRCTRERQGDRTLLDICLAVHMHVTGASDPIPIGRLEELVSILRDATRHWEKGRIECLEFDQAVRWLVDATLVEFDRHQAERFEKHLDTASQTVAGWPEWKRNVL